jgi:hypothetical protein
VDKKIELLFTVTSVDCDLIAKNVELTSSDILHELVTGDVTIAFGGRAVAMQGCGLLGLALTLRWLCMYPVMHDLPAFDIAHDDPIQFRSRYAEPDLLLSVSEIGSGDAEEWRLNPVEFLQAIGDQYRKTLSVLFERCPDILRYPKVLAAIPDANTLCHTLTRKS